MNKLNKKIEYALMALKLIQDKSEGGLLSAKEIADKLSISFEATARVLQALSSRGLLKAEYGVSGGYSLAKSLDLVSLHDLSEMLEGHTVLAKCLTNEDVCEVEAGCNIIAPVKNLNKKVQDFYKSMTLAEVLHV